jgi:hypothetical protein
MKLTPEESRLLQRMRRAEERWRATRWIILVTALALFLSPALQLFQPEHPLGYRGDTSGYSVSYERPLVPLELRLFSIAGSWFTCYVLFHWRGRLKNQLFIKLVEHAYAPLDGPKGSI